MLSKNLFDEKALEVNAISNYLTADTPLPQYLPYARFLLDTDLSHTAKLLYTLLLDRATLSQKNNWMDECGFVYVIFPLSSLSDALRCSTMSIALMGKKKHPIECSCQCIERTKQEALINQQKHNHLVRRLKAEGFSDPSMLDWAFENDNGRSPQMHHAHRYVEQWQTMRAENLGLLLWGGVGTGKSFLAGCIANALMEQEVPVRMTNFARILNELNSSFSGRNDIVDRLCRYPLLIIDDFGMERGTEYALEQIYNIVDSQYRSRKPLIVTTNLTLDEIRHPQDTAHARIYDRLLEMCVPISCIGVSLRKENAQEKLERLKLLIG